MVSSFAEEEARGKTRTGCSLEQEHQNQERVAAAACHLVRAAGMTSQEVLQAER